MFNSLTFFSLKKKTKLTRCFEASLYSTYFSDSQVSTTAIILIFFSECTSYTYNVLVRSIQKIQIINILHCTEDHMPEYYTKIKIAALDLNKTKSKSINIQITYLEFDSVYKFL